MEDKTFEEKERDRLVYIVKDLEKNGLERYEKYKDIILEYILKPLKKEIEDYNEKIKTMQRLPETNKGS